MASGLPIIGNNVGQIKLVLEEYENGMLTDVTIDDLIEKVMYVKNNRARAYEMGKNGRRAVVERHNWRNVALRLEEIILSLIEERKSSAFNLCLEEITNSSNKVIPINGSVFKSRRVSISGIIQNLKSRRIAGPLRWIKNKLTY